MEGLAGNIFVVVSVNRGAVDGRLPSNGTINSPATTYLVCRLALFTLPSEFFLSAIT